MFRVSAENIIGVSQPLESGLPITARDPVCKFVKAQIFVNLECYSCCILIFLAPPGRPEEIRAVDVTKDTVMLQWKPPAFDGGLEISEYFIEKRLIGQDRYLPATEKMVRENRFLLTGFNEGDNYEFRITAKNEKGTGPASIPSKPVVCHDAIEPPSLTLEAREKIVVRVGEQVRILAKIAGRPRPNVTWERAGGHLPSDDTRFKVKCNNLNILI